MFKIVMFLGIFWGVFYAVFLQQTKVGKFLVIHRTWITVVVGVGVDIAIMAIVMPFEHVVTVFSVFAASALGIVARSLYLESREVDAMQEYLDGKQDKNS